LTIPYAMQLARWAGLRAIATAADKDLAFVRSLGAGTVLDYKATRFEDAVCDVDAVIDLVGGEVQTRSFAVLRRGGALISAVSPPDPSLAAKHGVTAAFFLVDVTTERLDRIATMIETRCARHLCWCDSAPRRGTRGPRDAGAAPSAAAWKDCATRSRLTDATTVESHRHRARKSGFRFSMNAATPSA
jgi:hypothetical protein